MAASRGQPRWTVATRPPVAINEVHGHAGSVATRPLRGQWTAGWPSILAVAIAKVGHGHGAG